jgi:ABC-type transport system involved in cytochrome c biogenesis ATPase subunit
MPPAIVTRTCTRTNKIAIERLKGIRLLDEVSFEDKPITGIFGPNGNGKSTMLHALAAAYQAPTHASSRNYREFFPKLDHDIWNGTRFTVTHSGTLSTGGTFADAEEHYSKGTITTRWHPLEGRRPIREVVFLGVKSCLPALEQYASHDLSTAVYSQLVDRPAQRALEALGRILNGNYQSASSITLPNQPTRNYISFDRTADIGCRCSSVVMGAGEQRLFAMLRLIENTRNGALILIDELDLLLHGDALKKLIQHLTAHCTSKNKQIVFTSHREELLSLTDWINVRHLHRGPAGHRCFPDTDPDSLHRLTGERERPLEVFVEDDLAEAIVSRVSTELGASRHVRVIRFGCATNCFTVLAGLLLKGENCENSLFVLDGDVHLDPNDRQSQINSACAGNDPKAAAIRIEIATRITDFQLPSGVKPEPHLHAMIRGLAPNSLDVGEREIQEVANHIVNPPDTHHFVSSVIKELGESREAQLKGIVMLASKSTAWPGYVQTVRDWLTERIAALNLHTPSAL